MENASTKAILEIIRSSAYNENISMSEFARRAGVSKAWLSKLKHTNANLSIDTAIRLLDVAGYSLKISKNSTKNSSRISRLKKVAQCQDI